MLEQLKKKSIIKSLPAVIILLIAGAVLIGIEIPSFKSLIKGHLKFESLEPEEINDEIIVDASIDVNFGGFMEEYEENTKTHLRHTTDVYYIIWTGDENSEDYKYMGIKVPASYESIMDRMADATADYEYSDPISFSGAVNKMSEQEYQYFTEYFEESGWSREEIEEYTLPYYISVGTLIGGAASSVYVVMGIGIVLVIIGLIMLILALTGGSLKSYKKEIENAGLSLADAEYEYQAAKLLYKRTDLRISNRCIFYMTGSKPHMIANDKVIWAYQQNTTHRTNGIKTGTSYEILVYCLDSKKTAHIYIPNENAGREVLGYMNQMMPKAVIGYSDELVSLFRKDYQGFLQLCYYRTEQTESTEAADSAETAETSEQAEIPG